MERKKSPIWRISNYNIIICSMSCRWTEVGLVGRPFNSWYLGANQRLCATHQCRNKIDSVGMSANRTKEQPGMRGQNA